MSLLYAFGFYLGHQLAAGYRMLDAAWRRTSLGIQVAVILWVALICLILAFAEHKKLEGR